MGMAQAVTRSQNQWVAYTPGVLNWTVGNGGWAAFYRYDGATSLDLSIYFAWGNTSAYTASSAIVQLPAGFTARAGSGQQVLSYKHYAAGAGTVMGFGYLDAGGANINLYTAQSSTSTLQVALTNATTFGTGTAMTAGSNFNIYGTVSL